MTSSKNLARWRSKQATSDRSRHVHDRSSQTAAARAAPDARLPVSALFSRTGVRGVVGLGQVLVVEVRIHLRAGDRRVTQQLLHGAKVARRLQYVRRERVAEHVRMDV